MHIKERYGVFFSIVELEPFHSPCRLNPRHEIETPGENDLFLDQERALAKAYVYIVYDARNNSPPGLPRIIQEAFKEGRAALESNIYGSSTEWISPYSMR